MNWNDLPLWLSPRQVQDLRQIKRLGTIGDLCRDGRLPATKIGGQWRIDRDALRQQMATAVENARPTDKNLDAGQGSLGRMAAVAQDPALKTALANAQAAVNIVGRLGSLREVAKKYARRNGNGGKEQENDLWETDCKYYFDLASISCRDLGSRWKHSLD